MSGKPRKRKIYITLYEPDDKDYAIYTDVVNKLRNKDAEIVDILGNHSEWEIINNISKCQFIWLVTENSVREARCTIEVMTVLERAFRQNTINAVLLMHGNVKEQLLRVSVLDAMDKIQMKLNSDGTWKESQVNDILEELAQGDKDLRSRFPAGNLSHGFAYSHFFGFHNVILKRFEEKIKKSSWYQTHPDHFPRKIYELVPKSCRITSNITDKDKKVKLIGNLEKIEVVRAGNQGRPYELSVYTIKENGTDYYFVAQFPNAISAMAGMKDKKLAKMDDVDIMVQLTRYYYTMDKLLKYHGNDKVRLLLYNDEKENPHDVLLAAVKKDVSAQKQKPNGHSHYNENMVETVPFDQLKGTELDSSSQKTDPVLGTTKVVKKDAYIIHCQSCSEDSKIESKIRKGLKQRKLDIREHDFAGSRGKSLQDAFDESRWVVLVLSKDALKDRDFVEPSWIASEVNTTKCAKVIPVLIDVEPEDIPAMLNWLLYLHIHPYDSKQFTQEMDSLCSIIKGKNIEMTLGNYLPAGDVGYGLAWGYAMNYLPVVLNKITTFIKEAVQREQLSNCTYSERLYIVVPKSCNATGLLSDHEGVKRCLKLTSINDKRAGTNIIKTLDMYSVVDTDNKKYYFVGQFPAPVTCLFEMNDIRTAGLKEDTMQRESVNFCVTVQQILEQVVGPGPLSRCQFLEFDDKRPTALAEALINTIEEDPTKIVIA